jgi:thiamine-monophosphate kinase
MTPSAPSVIEGIGDDCAILRMGNRVMLASCDLSIENIHWRRSHATPEEIGWKAAASALSDIAAMGGVPLFALVSIACPPEVEVSFMEGLYDGLLDAMAQSGATIVGGDTTKSREGVVIDLTVLGESEGRVLMRKGAKPGDALVVTGFLGMASAGLDALESGARAPELAKAHYHPTPRFPEGQWLSERQEVHAMIDISDGLAQDAGHIAEASRIGVSIDSTRIPVEPRLAAYCAANGKNPLVFMISGGEDYELAFAADPASVEDLLREFRAQFHTSITIVGEFTQSDLGIRVDGAPATIKGFDHFAKKNAS